MKRKIYAALILLMLFFIVVPPSLGATTTAYNPMEYLTEEEQAYVTSMRAAISDARGAISSAKGELIPYFPDGYANWAVGLDAKIGAVNKSLATMSSITAPSAFGAVQAQAKNIEDYYGDYVSDGFDPYPMQNDLAYAVKAFTTVEADLNGTMGEVEAVSGTLEKTVAEVAKKQKMGADILDAMLSCDETAT